MKRVEYSKDFKTWELLGEWSDEEAPDRWSKLQQWIQEVQPFGFFRLVDHVIRIKPVTPAGGTDGTSQAEEA